MSRKSKYWHAWYNDENDSDCDDYANFTTEKGAAAWCIDAMLERNFNNDSPDTDLCDLIEPALAFVDAGDFDSALKVLNAQLYGGAGYCEAYPENESSSLHSLASAVRDARETIKESREEDASIDAVVNAAT